MNTWLINKYCIKLPSGGAPAKAAYVQPGTTATVNYVPSTSTAGSFIDSGPQATSAQLLAGAVAIPQGLHFPVSAASPRVTVANVTTAGSFTVAVWAYSFGFATGAPYFSLYDLTGDVTTMFTVQLASAANPAPAALSYTTLSSGSLSSPSSPLIARQWQHVALTLNNATGVAMVYVDGVARFGSPNLNSSGVQRTWQTAYIGGQQRSDLGFFKGYIASFQIYNTALTGPQISNLFR